MDTNSLRCNLSTITESVFLDVTTTTTHYITYQYIPTHQYMPTRTTTHSADTPHHQAHFASQDRYKLTSFQVARGLHRSTNTNVSYVMPRPTHSDTEGKAGPCAQREPTVGVLIVIVTERVIHTQHTPHPHTTPHHTTPHPP